MFIDIAVDRILARGLPAVDQDTQGNQDEDWDTNPDEEKDCHTQDRQ